MPFPINTVNGGEPQGDSPPLSDRPGAHVQLTHVPDPCLPAGKVSFAAAVRDHGLRYDPNEVSTLAYLTDPAYLPDMAKGLNLEFLR